MDKREKLEILAEGARYDVSCASGGSRRKKKQGALGLTVPTGICHSWSADGRCISLLKILYSNDCIYDCLYCVNGRSTEKRRATFTPEELIDITINFYRRNYIEGLFLSSAVQISPDHTMERLLYIVQTLRNKANFHGYIHLKAIPNASSSLIHAAGAFVDRMSVNVELPTRKSLQILAPEKKEEALLRPMGLIKERILKAGDEAKRFTKAPSFVPAGQSTQIIVGATDDSDLSILQRSHVLYKSFHLRRVYYSAYIPVREDTVLQRKPASPLLREHRLYQTDWLMRFYGFQVQEIVNRDYPDLDLALDPKSIWALRNLQFFPVEINKADYMLLLRIPGLGVRSARRIVMARKQGTLSLADLKQMGVVLKRARYFITCNGKYHGDISFQEEPLRRALLDEKPFHQPPLPFREQFSAMTGEV